MDRSKKIEVFSVSVLLLSISTLSTYRTIKYINQKTILLNQDADFGFGNDTYWNPHIVGYPKGSIASFTFNGEEVKMSLRAVDGSYGHLAMGSWWNKWSFTNFEKLDLDKYSVHLDVSLRVQNISVPSSSWLRVGIANAFFNGNISEDCDVFYLEFDVYDSPYIVYSPTGDIAFGGNVVYADMQTVELKIDALKNSSSFTEYQLEMTDYLHSVHWGKEIGSKLESSYIVIEWIGQADVDVAVESFELRISPKTHIPNMRN